MSARNLKPFLELTSFQGLFTKSSTEVLTAEQLRIAENIDFFESYGAITKLKGNSRVLSTPYTEGGVAQKIPWVGFHKTADLDGSVLRHVLVAAGTTIARLDGTSLTTLESNRLPGHFHSADRIDKFTYISNQNPDLVGDTDELIKYDGAVTTQWGVTPPGSQETVIESFYSTHPWTLSNCTISEESVVTWDGDAIKIDKTGTSTDNFSIERTLDLDNQFYVKGDNRTLLNAVADRVRWYTYIPRGSLTASNVTPGGVFATSGPAITVHAQNTKLNSNWEYDFTIGQLTEGWNILSLDFTSGAPSAGASTPAGKNTGNYDPERDEIDKIKFEFYLTSNTATVSGIRLDRLHKLDEGTPATEALGVGAFTGAYQYKASYVSKYGNESNAGPASVAITGADTGAFYLSYLPISPDPQVVSRRLYRTVAGGSVYLFLDEIFDNSTKTYEDSVADGSLGNASPPQAGDFSDDNSRPPRAGIVKSWKKTMFMAGDPQNPETLYFSEDNEPESFPLLNIFELDGKITAMYETYSGLVVETENGKWQVLGDNPDFAVDKIIEGMGCVGRRAAGTSRLIGYAVDRDGMRMFDLSNTHKISEPIRDKYTDDINRPNIELIHTVHSQNRNSITQFNPDAVGKYTSIFNYQYAVDDATQGYWSEIKMPSDLNILDAEEIEDSNGDFRIYAGGDDGMLYELFDTNSKNWVNATGFYTPIVMKIQTPYLREGLAGMETEGATGRVSPRFMELRTSGTDGARFYVTIDTSDGSSQTKARTSVGMNLEFGANNSLIRQAVPDREFVPAEYFRITVENNQVNVNRSIGGMRLYFSVQEAQFPVTDLDDEIT